ncbi:MAG: aromatic amino acid ammonia-lyase, partial [Desulfobacterales bacterium]|nr:aromatic amino acid ammonia-lyase [Desulfobacterales bacterium]
MEEIFLGVDGMTMEDLLAIARYEATVRLTEESEKRILSTRKLIEHWVQEEKIIYGVTTGFGALSDVIISKEDTWQLQ